MVMNARFVRLRFAVALAALTVPINTLPARAQANQKQATTASYAIDSEASRIYVKVGSATRLGHEHGVEGNLKSGKVTLGGEGELVFDLASLVADTPEARKRAGLEGKKLSENEAKKVTATMRGGEVLDVDRYPTATFKISSLTPLDKQAAGSPGSYQLEALF